MQVARLLEPRSERSFSRKAAPDGAGGRVEHALSKDQISALYLSLAPYGGNLEASGRPRSPIFGKGARAG